ncbi:hypothetical protein DKX38_015134 [Salix brachista]|uniref:Serine/threonine-protein kinase ULK4/RUNKEL HEAT repeats domain-containing protein n=1 Tax=Salix brachista TaxID=2182728 RepID=A0A5N5L680_9ROSI|nr:hypothetical protein DKX38_015134 [Salix brachista]
MCTVQMHMQSTFQGGHFHNYLLILSRDDFQITLLRVLESVAEERLVILEGPSIFTGEILPGLSVLYKDNKDGDARFLWLKILFEVMIIFLNKPLEDDQRSEALNYITGSVGSKRGLPYKKDSALLNDSSSEASTAVDKQQCIRDIMDFGSNVGVLLELSRSCEETITDIASEYRISESMQPQLVLAKLIIGMLSGWPQPNSPCSCVVPFRKELSSRYTLTVESRNSSLVHCYLSNHKATSVLIVPLMIYYPLLSSSTQLNSKTSNYLISTSPAILANPPSPSPFQELPPDIAPLLPSPGGVLPSPTVSSVPTIPSTPSPPDPDGVVAPGPGSAFSPLGPLPASSASPRNLINFAVAAGFIAYCIQHNASSYYSSDELMYCHRLPSLKSASLEKLSGFCQ